LDSGASWHLDPNEEFFTGLRDHEGTQIETSNGDIIKANQVGTLKARLLGSQDDISISMEDTFYVPELPIGLIPVARLTDKGIQVNFKHDKAIIIDRDGSILYEAHKRDGVYIIYMEHTGEYEYVRLSKDNDNTDNWKQGLWHWRFGHHSKDVLQEMADQQVVEEYEKKRKTEQNFVMVVNWPR